ncbi:MAG: DcrB-related protein [Pantoea sp.]|uniref:DcrB-related protein n=1 Tax=Pantoea septica TaxID=472695 RepID=UPI000E9B6036|nr:DcrB-related protein [Pantoea septica]MBU5379824.1 DcrB-related protein [Pantoea septica]MDU6441289.1 DcrB-related protein [Pantoea sp.]HAT23230.1 T6SS protein Cts1W [Pantoea septica]
MGNKFEVYSLYEGKFLTLNPLNDSSVNVLRYQDENERRYDILINRAAMAPDQTVEEFCDEQCERMKRFVPGFEVEGKNLKHEIGPAKLPVLQTACKFQEEGNWVRQVSSLVTLPRHPTINPDARNLLIFTLAASPDFTESQRKHYVRIINSFSPVEAPLTKEN